MLTILNTGTTGEIGVLENLYIRGDDDGLWYEAGMVYDSGLGIYLWSVGLYGSSPPSNSVNISDRVIGDSYFHRDGTNQWHQFTMTPTDPFMAYVWTDSNQSIVVPGVQRRLRKVRAEDGLNIVDQSGDQIHKMGVTGGLWSELNQGYSIPL